VLALSRQNVPTLDRASLAPADGLLRGAYVLNPRVEHPQVILMATGSEVQLIVAAEAELARRRVRARLVSMPCWELFAAESRAYRDDVLPPSVTRRVAVETGVSLGWERWVGPGGGTLTIDRFGASAPGARLLQEFGFTAAAVVAKAMEVLG
jgi:transketolase